jgi:hypothetical protein
MKDGILHFDCPKCGETLAVGLHIVAEFSEPSKTLFGTHYQHPVEFVAEAPHLHAKFWGHLVRCHQPYPHPYMSDIVGDSELA